MTADLWKRLGISDFVQLEINTLGNKEERAAHREALIKYLEGHVDILDEDGKRRLYTNRYGCWIPRIRPCRTWPTRHRA